MPAKTTVTVPNQLTVLKKPVEVFTAEIKSRIKRGKVLFNGNVFTKNDLEKLVDDCSTWHDYNEELLRRAFNESSNEYIGNYLGSIVGVPIETRFARKDPQSIKFQEHVEKQRLTGALASLQRLLKNLPVIYENAL